MGGGRAGQEEGTGYLNRNASLANCAAMKMGTPKYYIYRIIPNDADRVDKMTTSRCGPRAG